MGLAAAMPAGPGGSPGVRWCPSVPSVLPVPPVEQPLPPASLGLLPEETWEEAP